MKRLHLYALLCCVLLPIAACQKPATAEQAPASVQATKRADEPKAPVHPGYETATMWSTICDNYMIETNGVSACLHKTPKQIFEV